MPHAHNHPPNLTPPNPVPVPVPGTGPVIAIPYVSGAVSTFIEGRPAARCGDMGLSLLCGGFFPMFGATEPRSQLGSPRRRDGSDDPPPPP
jgi:hypothetical protein